MTADWKPQVYLVGAGPGDPGLLTRRAESLLQTADVVFHDALIDSGVLDLIPPDVERIAVGKRAGGIGPVQGSINEQLIEAVRSGRRVVRLKGGDPFIFGRGGEEMLALAEAGVRFEIVPGVSSASAVPAMIGVPLTIRGISSVIHIVTGHVDPADADSPVDWDLFTRPGHTVVVLMGSAHFIEILKRLRASGMDESTPIALIHWGTFSRQRSLRGTVGQALREPERFTLPSPTLAVIGGVAGLDEGLNWFERRPLFGRRVLLTRPRGEEAGMLAELREAGADAVNIPLVRLDETRKGTAEEFAAGLVELRSSHGWLILPSPASIRFLDVALKHLSLDARALAGIRIAVLSPRAAEQLASLGVRADFISEEADGATLASSLPLTGGERVMVGGSNLSRPEVRQILGDRGASVNLQVLYTNAPDEKGVREATERIQAGDFDDVILTSPSGVRSLFGRVEVTREILRAAARFWAIGKTTAGAMRESGVEPEGIAASPTAESLIDVMISQPDDARMKHDIIHESTP